MEREWMLARWELRWTPHPTCWVCINSPSWTFTFSFSALFSRSYNNVQVSPSSHDKVYAFQAMIYPPSFLPLHLLLYLISSGNVELPPAVPQMSQVFTVSLHIPFPLAFSLRHYMTHLSLTVPSSAKPPPHLQDRRKHPASALSPPLHHCPASPLILHLTHRCISLCLSLSSLLD